jgi:hypothetical protein
MRTHHAFRRLPLYLLVMCLCFFGANHNAIAAIIGVTGTVVVEPAPLPGPSDTEIFVFDEQ